MEAPQTLASLAGWPSRHRHLQDRPSGAETINNNRLEKNCDKLVTVSSQILACWSKI